MARIMHASDFATDESADEAAEENFRHFTQTLAIREGLARQASWSEREREREKARRTFRR